MGEGERKSGGKGEQEREAEGTSCGPLAGMRNSSMAILLGKQTLKTDKN